MSSATRTTDGSSRISAKSVVKIPRGAPTRSFAASRTSARTTRTRWPVARSMSSALSSSSRWTAAPTVPYPSSAIGTSTAVTRPIVISGCGEEVADPHVLGQQTAEARRVVAHVRAGEVAAGGVGDDVRAPRRVGDEADALLRLLRRRQRPPLRVRLRLVGGCTLLVDHEREVEPNPPQRARKSTRLNSSHTVISYAVFCLKKKTKQKASSSLLTTKK